MTSRSLLPALAIGLAIGSGACSADGPPVADADFSVGRSDQALIHATGNVMAWPAGPITWNGLVGTWPISVWSSMPIGALAFDVAGVSNLGVSCLRDPSITPVAISNPYFTAFGLAPAPLDGSTAPILGGAGLFAPAYGYSGVYAPFVDGGGYGFGAFAPWGSYKATWLNGDVTPGWTAWLEPSLTPSALMFNDLPSLDPFTPYTFQVTFQAQSDAQTALSSPAFSVFATPIAPTVLATMSAIPYMSVAYPIMPLPAGL